MVIHYRWIDQNIFLNGEILALLFRSPLFSLLSLFFYKNWASLISFRMAMSVTARPSLSALWLRCPLAWPLLVASCSPCPLILLKEVVNLGQCSIFTSRD